MECNLQMSCNKTTEYSLLITAVAQLAANLLRLGQKVIGTGQSGEDRLRDPCCIRLAPRRCEIEVVIEMDVHVGWELPHVWPTKSGTEDAEEQVDGGLLLSIGKCIGVIP